MTRRFFILWLFWGIGLMSFAQTNRVEEILSRMSLEEKAGQMTQINIDVIGVGGIYQLEEPHRVDPDKLRMAIETYHVGSILNCGGHAYTREHWLSIMNAIDDAGEKYSRSGVPILYGIDAIHGANYVMESVLFPQSIGQAATFNRQLVKDAARVTAYETRAVGIHWNFSPVLDVARHPAWSRVFETYGEDPYVCAELGAEVIKGYQGNDAADHDKVAACMKHFLGYSGMRTGKDRTPAYIPDNLMVEIFLPPFQKAIDAGALTLMINSGEINGVPVHASKKILTGLLRDQLKFEGVAVTDWEDVMKLHLNHHVAATMKEAVYLAVEAGIDMCMVPNDYEFTRLLIELVKEGRIREERLDISVRRILQLKEKLGLLTNWEVPQIKDYPKFNSIEHQLLAKQTALESITLLKNNNDVLPISASTKIAVTGPGAHSMIMLNGAWSRTWQGTDEKWDDPSKNTIYEALSLLYGSQQVELLPTCGAQEESLRSELTQVTTNADVILFCASEQPGTEKPGDIHELQLSAAQIEYFRYLKSLGKKMILVLLEDRPRIIREIEPLADAVVLAYRPGDEGGNVIAEVIMGKFNPCGRLPYTYPRYEQSLLTYDHKYTEQFDSNYGKEAFQPQWEFGTGLHYGTCKYMSMRVVSEIPGVSLEVQMENQSDRAVSETVLVFYSDLYASVTPSVKKLVAFHKVYMEPGAKKEILITIDENLLRTCQADGTWVLEPGDGIFSIENLQVPFVIK